MPPCGTNARDLLSGRGMGLGCWGLYLHLLCLKTLDAGKDLFLMARQRYSHLIQFTVVEKEGRKEKEPW